LRAQSEALAAMRTSPFFLTHALITLSEVFAAVAMPRETSTAVAVARAVRIRATRPNRI